MLQWLPGSFGLVSFGGEPARVPDELVQKIRQRVDEINISGDAFPETFKPGENVVIHSGPFAGYKGIFCSWLDPGERAQVLLTMLQSHAIRVDLPVEQLTRAKQSKPLP